MDLRHRRLPLSDYASLLWQRRLVVLAAVLVATVVGLLTAPSEPPSLYEATADLRFQALPSGPEASTGSPETVPSSEVEAARSAETATQTAEELEIAGGGSALLSRLKSEAVEGTGVLRLTLTGENPEVERWLEAYAENYVADRTDQEERTARLAVEDLTSQISVLRKRLSQLQEAKSAVAEARFAAVRALYSQLVAERERTRLETQLPGGPVRLLGAPTSERVDALPTSPLRPVVAPVVGLLLGSALALLIGIWRPSVGGRRRTEEVMRYPVLAEIARGRRLRTVRGLALGQGEGVRALRSKLQLLGRDRRWRGIIAVTSPQRRDGRTEVAGHLAASFAGAGRRTLWLKDDLAPARRGMPPGMDGALHAAHRHGLSIARLSDIPGVDDDASPEAVDRSLQELDAAYDVVIFEVPPVTASVDALVVCCRSDAVVLVLDQGRTQEARSLDAISTLERYDAPLVGLVLRGTRLRRGRRARGSEGGGAPEAPGSLSAPDRDQVEDDERGSPNEADAAEVFASGHRGPGPS